jgi:hypothetical protein
LSGTLPGTLSGTLPGALPGTWCGALPGNYLEHDVEHCLEITWNIAWNMMSSITWKLPGTWRGALPGNYLGHDVEHCLEITWNMMWNISWKLAGTLRGTLPGNYLEHNVEHCLDAHCHRQSYGGPPGCCSHIVTGRPAAAPTFTLHISQPFIPTTLLNHDFVKTHRLRYVCYILLDITGSFDNRTNCVNSTVWSFSWRNFLKTCIMSGLLYNELLSAHFKHKRIFFMCLRPALLCWSATCCTCLTLKCYLRVWTLLCDTQLAVWLCRCCMYCIRTPAAQRVSAVCRLRFQTWVYNRLTQRICRDSKALDLN